MYCLVDKKSGNINAMVVLTNFNFSFNMLVYYKLKTFPQFCYCFLTKLYSVSRCILQPQYTDNAQNICEGVITNALQSSSKELSGS